MFFFSILFYDTQDIERQLIKVGNISLGNENKSSIEG